MVEWLATVKWFGQNSYQYSDLYRNENLAFLEDGGALSRMPYPMYYRDLAHKYINTHADEFALKTCHNQFHLEQF